MTKFNELILHELINDNRCVYTICYGYFFYSDKNVLYVFDHNKKYWCSYNLNYIERWTYR